MTQPTDDELQDIWRRAPWGQNAYRIIWDAAQKAVQVGIPTTLPAVDTRIAALQRRVEREEKKSAAANKELLAIKQESARLRLENSIQRTWLDGEALTAQRYKALVARMSLLRDVLDEGFPEKYGVAGEYNWFGEKSK